MSSKNIFKSNDDNLTQEYRNNFEQSIHYHVDL